MGNSKLSREGGAGSIRGVESCIASSKVLNLAPHVQPPLVTAVIPAFNSEATLARAIESVLTQTYRPLDVVVVDDSSTDGSSRLVEGYCDRGVTLLRLEKQRGASGARNAGIAAARGELVAFLDSDDEWLPLKLEKQVALLLSDKEYVFVACAAEEFSPAGKYLGDLYMGRRPVTGADCWKSLLGCNTIATPSVLVWRRHLLDAGGFDETLRVCEDQDMWIRLASRGSVGYVDEALVRVHDRVNSLSSNLSVRTLRIALDVVERNLAKQRSRLAASDVRKIRAERLEWIGRAECNSDYLRGLPTMLRALLTFYRPFGTALFLVSASPPSRWVKERIYPRRWRTTDRISGRPGKIAAGTAARVRHPMLPANDAAQIRFPLHERPRLVVIVDAEEEFDWSNPLSRDNRSVQTMRAQHRTREIYRRYKIVPTYAVDYPVVAQEAGYGPVMDMLGAGECDVGAQLHPWVTPPFEEEVGEETSYPGNLPGSLEQRKLATLVDAIERRFGARPRLYRAGRYGTGSNTVSIIERMGFDIDCSVVPGVSRWSSYAPDYSGGTAHPYWLQTERPILELPVTVAPVGPARHLGEEFYRTIHSEHAMRLRLSGLMARTGLLNRIRLSPEGSTLREARHLTRSLWERGYRLFSLSYHSPSLEPGHTPYVRNQTDLDRFLAWIERYLEFFFGELGGLPETPSGAFAWARSHSIPPVCNPPLVGAVRSSHLSVAAVMPAKVLT